MRMVLRPSVVVVGHHRGQLLVNIVDDPTPQHTGATHIAVRHDHVSADVGYVHTALYRAHRHCRM